MVQKRGMARIQRTHHPIFQGSLETSTFSPIDSAVGCGADSTGPAPVSQASPSAEATAQVVFFGTMRIWGICLLQRLSSNVKGSLDRWHAAEECLSRCPLMRLRILFQVTLLFNTCMMPT